MSTDHENATVEILLEGPQALRSVIVVDRQWKPIPRIELTFRLAELPDVGILRFVSNSWSFAAQVAEDAVAERLQSIGGPAKATIEIEDVTFVARRGNRVGQTVSYKKPILRIVGPATS